MSSFDYFVYREGLIVAECVYLLDAILMCAHVPQAYVYSAKHGIEAYRHADFSAISVEQASKIQRDYLAATYK